MNKIRTAISLAHNNRSEFKASIVKNLGFLLSDKKYLELIFKFKVGYPLNLDNPRTYNEKLQWLKLYCHRPEFTTMVDKYDVKDYVSGKIGSEYVIPTLGVWDSPDQIEWCALPERFVLKTTQGGGSCGVIICKNREKLNRTKVANDLRTAQKYNIFKEFREWPYKNVKSRIIAEELLEEPEFEAPRDYKVMCFDGKVKLIEYHEGRFTENHTQDFYDRNWNKTSITQGAYGELSSQIAERPECLDKMIELSEILSKDLPHVRVDWYFVKGNLYFGELTFFDGSGLCPWDRYEDDLLMGSWITLPKEKIDDKVEKEQVYQGIDMFY